MTLNEYADIVKEPPNSNLTTDFEFLRGSDAFTDVVVFTGTFPLFSLPHDGCRALTIAGPIPLDCVFTSSLGQESLSTHHRKKIPPSDQNSPLVGRQGCGLSAKEGV